MHVIGILFCRACFGSVFGFSSISVVLPGFGDAFCSSAPPSCGFDQVSLFVVLAVITCFLSEVFPFGLRHIIKPGRVCGAFGYIFSILRGSPDRLFMDTSEDIFFSGWDVCQHGAYVCIFSFPCLRFISCLDRSIDGFRAPYGVVFIFYFLNIRVSETVVFITVIGGHVPDIVEIFLIRQVDFHHSVGVFDDLVVIIRFRNAFVVFIFQYSMVFRVILTYSFLAFEIYGAGLCESTKPHSREMLYAPFVIVMLSVYLFSVHVGFRNGYQRLFPVSGCIRVRSRDVVTVYSFFFPAFVHQGIFILFHHPETVYHSREEAFFRVVALERILYKLFTVYTDKFCGISIFSLYIGR